jgi:hypothetical protein
MRRLIHTILIAGAFLVLGCTANAQRRPDSRDDPYRAYGRGPLDRVRADLNRAARDMNYLSEGEIRRFNRVRDRIAEFQGNWERGRFDREALDEVINGLNGVIDRSHLRPRDRDVLTDDLARLRQLREEHGRGFRYR